MAAKSRAKWEHYCAEKDSYGPEDWRRQREASRKRPKAKPVNPLDHQLRQVEAENRKVASPVRTADGRITIPGPYLPPSKGAEPARKGSQSCTAGGIDELLPSCWGIVLEPCTADQTSSFASAATPIRPE